MKARALGFVSLLLLLLMVAVGFAQGLSGAAAGGPARRTENVVVIVTDGLRWQEVFGGAEAVLISSKPGGVEDEAATKRAFWREAAEGIRDAFDSTSSRPRKSPRPRASPADS